MHSTPHIRAPHGISSRGFAGATTLFALLLVSGPDVQAAPFAYVANHFSSSISVIDTATHTVTATVALPERPNGVAVNPAGTRVYVTLQYVNSVAVIDTTSNTVITTVPVGQFPIRLVVNLAGTRVYVTNQSSGTVSVIDTATNTVTATVIVAGSPMGLAINPGGTRLYVGNLSSNRVSVVDTASNSVVATVAGASGVLQAPRELVVSPDGTRVYATDYGSGTLWVIDTACNSATFVPGAGASHGVATNPAGTRVYMADYLSNTVRVLDVASRAFITTVAVGSGPSSVAVDATGARVYVTNLSSHTVSVIDTSTNSVTATVGVGNTPAGVALATGVVFVPPPPVAALTVRVTGMEVTQAIQDLDNNVPLVSGRRTFVRVYVQADGAAVPGVTATLSGAGAFCTNSGCVTGIPLGSLVPVNSIGPRLTISPSPQRSNVNDSFLFELPWQWTDYVSVRLHVELSAGPGPPPAGCPAGDSDPLFDFDFRRTTMKIAFVRMAYQLPGTFAGPNGGFAQTSAAEQRQSESWIRRTYPLTELRATPDLTLFDPFLGGWVARSDPGCLVAHASAERDECAKTYTVARLAALQAASGFMGDADMAYGLIPRHPSGPFTRGACCQDRIGAGPSNDPDYAAHEVGHFLGRNHPVQGAAVCGHSAEDASYPYFLSFIAPPLSSPGTGLAGFDTGDAGLLLPRGLHAAGSSRDVMGYCGPSWISDYTYRQLYVCLTAMNSDLEGVTPGCGVAGDTRRGRTEPQEGDWLIAHGTIASDLSSAAFIVTQRVGRVFGVPPRTPGSHSIRLVDAGGVTLADYPFTPEAMSDGAQAAAGASAPQLSFGQVVPFLGATRAVQIVQTSTDTVLAAKVVSANAPTVANVTVQGQPNPVSGALAIGWTATDPDGDPLTFDVFYTRNGGTSLQPVLLGLSNTSAQVDTTRLGGGLVQLRVVATDGVHSAFADTAPFTLPTKPPQPRILTPGDGGTIYAGQLVNFKGEATDPQDGVIVDTGLAWHAPTGTLGSGSRLSITDLPVGANAVTLTATNSLGLSASTTVIINVDGDVSPRGPTLTAGPIEVGWHVAAPGGPPQTATLDVGNGGSGRLEFTAHSSASWLTVSAVSGEAPATVTLHADPSGIPDGATEDAVVTLTAVGVPNQAITVAAHLSVGNTFLVGSVAEPRVSPPADVTIAATEAGGATGSGSAALASFLTAGSAVDAVDLSPTRLAPQVDGVDVDNTTFFPPGITSVTFRFRDASGNVGSATALVTVLPGTSQGLFHRYFAEGATSSLFDTQLALLNPGTFATLATLTFSQMGGAPITQQVLVPARTRVTLNPKTIPGLAAAEFSTEIESDELLVVDRTMTWDAATGYGSHAETAVAAPSPTWYLAEGATHSGFDLFYLLQNPAPTPTTVRVRYLLPSGAPLEKDYVLPANSRTNIWVDTEDVAGQGLALTNTDVSAVITSLDATPIIVERAMYLTRQGRPFNAGHESMGVTMPATTWFLAEGATGPFFDLYVLIANPSAQDAQVQVTYLLPDGTTYSRVLTAPASSRSNIWVDAEQFAGVSGFPLADVAVSTTVTSTNGVGIVVERAMWWPGDGATWHEAHNSAGATGTGTAWALAEGEVGGTRNIETYILIANTSTFAGSATVTLLFEDGTSAIKVYALPANSRTNVAAGPDFGSVVEGKRFGAIVESTGTTPAQLVVERAMYADAAGVKWAAGTNAPAVKLR